MTDLTEQWEKGELPSGFYYIELPEGRGGNGISKYTTFISPTSKIRIKEVLAPVPSYEEWKKAYECVVSENEEITTLKKCWKSVGTS